MSDPINPEFSCLKSMWVATTLMWLIYGAHIVASDLVRFWALSTIQKHGYGLVQQDAGAERRTDRIHNDWLLRLRHAQRVVRETALFLLFLVVLTQNVLFHPIPHYDTLPEERRPLISVFSPSIHYPLFFAWTVFGLGMLQWLAIIVIEPIVNAADAYEYFGPGLHGRREDRTRWVDAVVDGIKWVLVLLVIIQAYKEQGKYDWTDAFKWMQPA